MVLGEEGRGIAIVKADFMKKMAMKILDNMGSAEDETGEGSDRKSYPTRKFLHQA